MLDTSLLEITPLNNPYWDSLLAGVLSFQACRLCTHRWLPPRALCPACLRDQWHWQPASGQATLVSWTVFHVPYHAAFAERLPYNVALVQLHEGPRMISNVLNRPNGAGLRIGMPLTLVVEKENGIAVARFV